MVSNHNPQAGLQSCTLALGLQYNAGLQKRHAPRTAQIDKMPGSASHTASSWQRLLSHQTDALTRPSMS